MENKLNVLVNQFADTYLSAESNFNKFVKNAGNVVKSNVNNNFERLNLVYTQFVSEVNKFLEKGNKAAGTRARKSIMEMKSIEQDIRVQVIDIKNDEKLAAEVNKAAGTRLRKDMIDMRRLGQEIRAAIQAVKNSEN